MLPSTTVVLVIVWPLFLGGVDVEGAVRLCLPVIVGGCGVVLVVASCEGHMVDALASRADEGRRSLR